MRLPVNKRNNRSKKGHGNDVNNFKCNIRIDNEYTVNMLSNENKEFLKYNWERANPDMFMAALEILGLDGGRVGGP